MTLKGSEVMNLVNAIVPLYILIALGYSMSKLKVLSHEQHYAGIVTFCFKVTTPPLVFQLVATNNPYALNLRLVGADTMCKFLILLALSLSSFRRPTANRVAWVSAYFNLATMSNTVLVGIPLVTALYPGTEKDLTAIIFMQTLLWFSVCIFILELHKALLDNNYKKGNEQDLDLVNEVAAVDLEKDARLTHTQYSQSGHTRGGGNDTRSSSFEQRNAEVVEAPTAAVGGRGMMDPRENGQHQHLDIDVVHGNDHDNVVDSRIGSRLAEPAADMRTCSLSKLHLVKTIMMTVAANFVWSPIVWSSIIGFIYALLNFKFNDGKRLPVILKSSVQLLANCTLGMAMFMLGMHMAAQKRLMACGIYKALLGALIRFFVSPAMMAVASLVFGLRGEMFRFAVLQAMIPQSITSFVFACNYHVHEETFSTAVWFQTLIFFPFAIALYTILNISA